MDGKKMTHLEGIIGKVNMEKIGKFEESTGGGTPLAKGEKLKDHPEARRVNQPRDNDGKFTYNSVNEKPLKYGPSRGVTIPPFLRDVDLKFVRKSKDVVIREGITYLSSLNIKPEQLVNLCRSYMVMKENLYQYMERKKGRKSKEEKQAISEGYEGYLKRKGKIGGGITIKPGQNEPSIGKWIERTFKKPIKLKEGERYFKERN